MESWEADLDDRADDPASLDAAVLAALDALDTGGWGDSLGTAYDAQGTGSSSGSISTLSQPGRQGDEYGRAGGRGASRPGAPSHAPAGWENGGGGSTVVEGIPTAGAAVVPGPDAGRGGRPATPPGPAHRPAVAPSAGVPLKFFARRGGKEEEEVVGGAVSDDEDAGSGPQQQQQAQHQDGPRPSSRQASQRRLAALEAAWAAEAAAQEERLSRLQARPSSRASSDGGAVAAGWKAEAARQVALGISPSAPGSVLDEEEHDRLVRQSTPQPRPTPSSTPLPPPYGAEHPRLRRTPPPRPDSAASSLSSLHDGGGSQQGSAKAMDDVRASWQQTRGQLPPGPAEGMLAEDADGNGQGTWFGPPAAELLHRALVTPTAPADVGPKEYTPSDQAVPPTDLVGDLTQVPGVLLEAGTRLVSALREGVDRDLAEQRRAASDAVARLVIALGSGLPMAGTDESMDGAALRRRGGSLPVSPQAAGIASPFAPPVQLSGWQEAMLEAVQSMEESLERHHASAAAACRAVESDVLRVSLAMQDTGNTRTQADVDAASQKTLLQRWLETAFGSKAAYDQWLHTVAASLCLTPDARRGCLAVLRSLEPMRRQAINRRRAALVAEVVTEREVTASRGGTPVLFRPTSAANSGANSVRSTAADARSGEQQQQASRPGTAMSGGGGEGNGDEGDDTRGILLERLPGLTDEDLERMAEFLGSDVGSVWGDGDEESVLAGETGTGLASSPVPGRPPVDDATYAAAQRVARMVAEARAAAALREQQRAAKGGGSASGDSQPQHVAAVRTGEADSPAQAPTSPQNEAAAAAAAAASFFVPSKGGSRASSRMSGHHQAAGGDDSASVAPPSSGVATAVVGMFTRDTWLQQPPPQHTGLVRTSAALLGGDSASLAAQRPAPPDRSVAGRPRAVAPAASSAGGSSSRQTGRVNISSSDEEDAPQAQRRQQAAPGVGDATDGSAGGWGFDKSETLKRRGVTPLVTPKPPATAPPGKQHSVVAKPSGGGVLGAVWRSVAGGGAAAAGGAGMASDSSAGSAHRAARRAKRAAQLTGGAGPGLRGARPKRASGAGPQWLAIVTLAAQALGTLVVVALIALVLIMALF